MILVPPKPPRGYQLPEQTDKIKSVYKTLEQLFKEQPVWSKRELILRTEV